MKTRIGYQILKIKSLSWLTSLPTPAQGRNLRDEDSLASSSPGSSTAVSGFKKPVSSRAHSIASHSSLGGVSRPRHCNKALKQQPGICHPLVALPHSMAGRRVKGSESRCHLSRVTSHLSCALVSESPWFLKMSFASFFLVRWHPGK